MRGFVGRDFVFEYFGASSLLFCVESLDAWSISGARRERCMWRFRVLMNTELSRLPTNIGATVYV